MSEFDIPKEWTFENADVAKNFDAHVREQLPWYDLLTGVVAHVGRHFVPKHGLVYDLGASTGNVSSILSPCLEERSADCISLESSAEMVKLWRGYGKLLHESVLEHKYEPHDFCVSFLLLLFLSPKEQHQLLDTLWDALNPGGAILIVDKDAEFGGYLSVVMHRLALAGKLESGAEPKDIIDKELSLSGVQRPISSKLLAKFDAKEIFRFGEFAAWLILK